MTKTPATSAAPGTEPPELVLAKENTTPPEVDKTVDIEWTAFQFARSILANPRGDQMLRIGSIYSPDQLGAELAIACWNLAASFTHHTAQLRHAHNNPKKEHAQ